MQSGGPKVCYAARMAQNRNAPEVQALPPIFEARAQAQPAGRGVPQGVTAREAAFWLDTWSQLSQAVGGSQLLYHEATLLNPARTSVVLGDPAHAARVPVVVFANAPNSLREVESTTTFRTR